MANQGIIHLSGSRGGRPYCNSRRAIMSTTPDRIQVDGWTRVCIKCETVRRNWEAKEVRRSETAAAEWDSAHGIEN